ncbi:MAG: DUF2723 domain-containing protein [Bacteroidetes bacterium]|nr:DUF2723 domain-containing protein [Bacteroidota bacterium]
MKIYSRLNNILGWVIFLIASLVYILTSEPTTSFWDCGEYIATAYKLQVGHPPGAPLFQMLGRFFSLFAMGDTALVARMVNTMSAMASGFTILFLFWTITILAGKPVFKEGSDYTPVKIWTVLGGGIIGALAYTFSDSFWFSAVEGEVYAMSSFFTAFVFWAILKWEAVADQNHAYRWIILIAFMMGLSIGVHLLNLLAIPAITFVYYFKKYQPSPKGILVSLVVSFLILSVVMYGIIPWIVKLAGYFELAAVNGLGLPFNSGTIIYFLLVAASILFGLSYTRRRNKVILNTAILSFLFILIGYSSFLMLIIRSNANTPINENAPTNAISLLAYLNREQYGDWPLLTGPYYNAPMKPKSEWKDGTPVYAKDETKKKYVITEDRKRSIPTYDDRFVTIFPRMWSNTEQRYIDGYKQWGKIRGVPVKVSRGEDKTEMKPTFGENLRYFFSYQLNYMYFRYFMWNFAGRQNDLQGFGSPVEGNWISGIGFLDEWRLGPQDNLPASMKNNARNTFFFLPLLLGLAGLFYQWKKDKPNGYIVSLLFIMTGIAIVVYLNQTAPQPRERDYAYAASFYAFAIWIGLGIIALVSWVRKYLNEKLSLGLVLLATFFCVPGLMAWQGWDDHDRSGRYTALNVAENYLNSCEKDAVLFTNGDNDTFPLWYAQEVEGIRTDVRVVNLSLLNTDWYIDQMKRKVYDSEPVPFSLTRERYKMGTRDFIYFMPDDRIQGYINLKELFHILNTNEAMLKVNYPEYGLIEFFPGNKFKVEADTETVIRNRVVSSRDRDRIIPLEWEIDGPGVDKSEMMILDLLATNDWKRPVYFTMTTGPDTYIGLDRYLFLEGLTYRLLPLRSNKSDEQIGSVNTDAMYDHLMNKFKWGNLKDPDVYLDENIMRMTMNFRNMAGRLALALIAEGKKDTALQVLDKIEMEIPDPKIPHSYFSANIGDAYIQADQREKGEVILIRIFTLVRERFDYYSRFPNSMLKSLSLNVQQDLAVLEKVSSLARKHQIKDLKAQTDQYFQKYYQWYMDRIY